MQRVWGEVNLLISAFVAWSFFASFVSENYEKFLFFALNFHPLVCSLAREFLVFSLTRASKKERKKSFFSLINKLERLSKVSLFKVLMKARNNRTTRRVIAPRCGSIWCALFAFFSWEKKVFTEFRWWFVIENTWNYLEIVLFPSQILLVACQNASRNEFFH